MDMEMCCLRRAERTSLRDSAQERKGQNRAGIALPLAQIGTGAETQIPRFQLTVLSGAGALAESDKSACIARAACCQPNLARLPGP
jgi:hypothetical protein